MTKHLNTTRTGYDLHPVLPVLTHGGLFEGIGGFTYSAKQLGIETKWICEVDDWNLKLLKQHYGKAKQYKDIRDCKNPGYVDIITGGFPCQDISTSGRGEGIKGSRSGLWSEMWRVIREVRPKYVIIENSPALLIRGFEQVLCDLSKIGYLCEWECLSAEDFGASHKRERLFAVAYTDSNGFQGVLQRLEKGSSILPKPSNKIVISALPESFEQLGNHKRIREYDGVPNQLHRIKGCGNAIVTTVGRAVLLSIMKTELDLHCQHYVI